MKAIRMRIEKSSRWVAVVLASVVAILTSAVVANATQTITTPNAVSYNLVAGGNSAPITPATDRSVLVMGCCTTTGFEAAGQLTLLRHPSLSIGWVGFECPTNVAITSGFGSAANTHIVYIELGHLVDIQRAGVDTIRIHNGSAGTRAGNVTLIW